MGNTLEEWDRTYDLQFKQRKVDASLQELHQRRAAMFDTSLAQEHLEGMPETDDEGYDDIGGSNKDSGSEYGSGSDSDERSSDVEPEPPLIPAVSLAKTTSTGGRRSTGKWSLPAGVEPMAVADALLLGQPELSRRVTDMIGESPASQNGADPKLLLLLPESIFFSHKRE